MNKKHVIGYPVTAILAMTIGAAGASGSSTPTTVAAAPLPAVTVTVTVPGPAVTVTAPAPVAAKPAPAPVVAPVAATIEEGQWEVGVDVPAGVYKVTAAVDPSAQCYWKITQHGSPDNIINNDIVAGGKPTVTLKKGQDFTTQSCGTWVKVR